MKTLTEKELFAKDFELIKKISPESAAKIFHLNVDRFPKDPLVLFIVKEEVPDRYLVSKRFWTQVYIKVTNQEKLKAFFEEKGNAFPREQLYILFPFQFIQSKYISLDWEELELVLVFSRLSPDNQEERNEFDLFLIFFQRYLKFTCDVDIIEINEL